MKEVSIYGYSTVVKSQVVPRCIFYVKPRFHYYLMASFIKNISTVEDLSKNNRQSTD